MHIPSGCRNRIFISMHRTYRNTLRCLQWPDVLNITICFEIPSLKQIPGYSSPFKPTLQPQTQAWEENPQAGGDTGWRRRTEGQFGGGGQRDKSCLCFLLAFVSTQPWGCLYLLSKEPCPLPCPLTKQALLYSGEPQSGPACLLFG